MIRLEELQYDINRERAKKSALWSGKIDRYEYLTVEEILPFDQRRVIKQAEFTYFPLAKAFEKQITAIKDQRGGLIKSLEKHRKQLVKSSGEKIL